jgi:Ras-related C3 botulinum toxin substrate 1
MKQINCVVVGDDAVGKTCLLLIYTTNAFPCGPFPPVIDAYCTNVMIEDQQINLQLWDTTEQEDCKKLCSPSFPQPDVFVICFSLVAQTSLENVQNVWVPEIKEHYPTTPYILVGMKSDLREQFAQHVDEYRNRGWEPVSRSKAEDMKRSIGAHGYIECSTKFGYNLNEVFDAAIKVVLHRASSERVRSETSEGGCCNVI